MATLPTSLSQAQAFVQDTLAGTQQTVHATVQSALGAAEAVRQASADLFNAGVGAYVTLNEEVRTTYAALVEKGKAAQVPQPETLVEQPKAFVEQQVAAFEHQVKDLLAKAQSDLQARVDAVNAAYEARVLDAQQTVEDLVGAVLHRMGLPTREDVQQLNETVAALNARVEALGREA